MTVRGAGGERRIPILRIGGPAARRARCFPRTIVYDRPWRRWITQQIPILKIGGSNPSGRAIKETSFFYQGKRGFCVYFPDGLWYNDPVTPFGSLTLPEKKELKSSSSSMTPAPAAVCPQATKDLRSLICCSPNREKKSSSRTSTAASGTKISKHTWSSRRISA